MIIKILVIAVILGGAYYAYKYLDWQKWIPQQEEIEPQIEDENIEDSPSEKEQTEPEKKSVVKNDVQIVRDTVYKTIIVDPNDPESVRQYEKAVREAQIQSDEVIIETENIEAKNDSIKNLNNIPSSLRDELENFNPEFY